MQSTGAATRNGKKCGCLCRWVKCPGILTARHCELRYGVFARMLCRSWLITPVSCLACVFAHVFMVCERFLLILPQAAADESLATFLVYCCLSEHLFPLIKRKRKNFQFAPVAGDVWTIPCSLDRDWQAQERSDTTQSYTYNTAIVATTTTSLRRVSKTYIAPRGRRRHCNNDEL